jgi:catechol 2,3-dioxygenase-like lactoylglutathione lyase family enzyme
VRRGLSAVTRRRFVGLAGTALILVLLATLSARSRPGQSESPRPSSAAAAPIAHFHHLHLNSTDPDAAVKFYASKFDCEQAKLGGTIDAIWAQKSWILINKVHSPPPWQLTAAIWHFGWGAEDMQATYQKQLDSGTKFFTPITQLAPTFFFAYVEGPDHALIELNTANHHHFGHLHLLSQDPIMAAEWYMKYFGATPRGTWPPSREPRFRKEIQIGPSASLMVDNVNIIIYPIEYSKGAYKDHWKDQTAMSPTEGRVVDHAAFSFENLEESLAKMRKEGVTVAQGIRTTEKGKLKSAFIEGPDKIRIELVQGQAQKQ